MTEDILSIVVVSTDSYSDLWPDFFKCLKDYWPDCPYKIYLVNNTLNPNFDGVEVINSGENAQWSERTRNALHKIPTKFVCCLLEDFFISEKVDTVVVKDAIDFMEKEGLLYYKILSLSKFTTENYKSIPYLQTIPASYRYGISLMASIWDKTFFLEKIGKENYNPWKFEVDRLNEEKEAEDPFKTVGVFDNRNILKITHMVVQGKYLPYSLRKMQKKGYCRSLYRPIMSVLSYRIYNLKDHVGALSIQYPIIKKLLYPLRKYSVSEKNK